MMLDIKAGWRRHHQLHKRGETRWQPGARTAGGGVRLIERVAHQTALQVVTGEEEVVTSPAL